MFKVLVVQCFSTAAGMSVIPGWGTKIPHDVSKKEKNKVLNGQLI